MMMCVRIMFVFFFFFKQKTAYEMRISDWSSDVCSSDLELLSAMWRYRFLHRDLEHLLDSDPDLAARYRRFSQRSLIHGTAIYEGFVAAGILKMDRVQIESLTLNAWIIQIGRAHV